MEYGFFGFAKNEPWEMKIKKLIIVDEINILSMTKMVLFYYLLLYIFCNKIYFSLSNLISSSQTDTIQVKS